MVRAIRGIAKVIGRGEEGREERRAEIRVLDMAVCLEPGRGSGDAGEVGEEQDCAVLSKWKEGLTSQCDTPQQRAVRVPQGTSSRG